MAEIELTMLLRRLARQWQVVICCLLISVAIAAAYYLLAEPVYEAQVIVQPSRDADNSLSALAGLTNRLGSLAGLGGLSTSKGERYDQTLALLRSLGFFATFDSRTGFRELLHNRSQEASLGWLKGDARLTLAEAQRIFQANYFEIVEDPGTSVIWLRMRSWDPDLAAKWLDVIVASVNQAAAERDRQLSDTMLTYLNAELYKTEHVETRQAIAALVQRETERRMLATVTKDYALVVIDRARPPEEKDFVAPDLAVCMLLGVLGGIASSVLIIVWRDRDAVGIY